MDRWREGELREGLQAVAFPVAPLLVRGNGYKDGAETCGRSARLSWMDT